MEPVTDLFSAGVATEIVQLRTLLTNCGRELAQGPYQWEQLTKRHSFSTGASPPASGRFDLPSDFGSLIDQTMWSPQSGGTGLPVIGPLTEQTWAQVVSSGSISQIQLMFKVTERALYVLPAPPPPSTTITFAYRSQNWVLVNGSPTTTATFVANNGDVVLFDSVLMVKMLVYRFKSARGLARPEDALAFSETLHTAVNVNKPAPHVHLTTITRSTLIDPRFQIPNIGV
ncbi:MAG: hypothetical protein NZ534_00040 [Bacteroidia bacterium]|nr:hypothetical protein [Bacteroidia bacterium]